MGKTNKCMLLIVIIVVASLIPLILHFWEDIENITEIKNHCRIKVSNFTERSAILLTEDNKFKIPNDSMVQWTDKEEISYFVCPGISGNNESLDYVTCFSDDKFHHSQLAFEPVNNFLNCPQPVESSVEITADGLRIGFSYENGSESKWITLYDIVRKNFDNETGSYKTYYTIHDLYHGVGFTKITHNRTQPLKADESGFNVNEILDKYEKMNQKSTDANRLVPGQLIPAADMVFMTWQMATDYYANTQPIFESVKNGNLETVESLIREKVAEYKDALVYTGIIPRSTENSNPKFKMLAVPQYIWKILKIDSELIAFVIQNDIDVDAEPVCNDICEATNWNIHNKEKKELGRTICCNISEFVRKFQINVPNHFSQTSQILQGPTRGRV